MIAGHPTQAAAPAADRPGAALARFEERRGHRVFEAAGAIWAQWRRYFHVSLPYELELDVDPRELARALRAERVAAVRYPSRAQRGLASGLYVCAPSSYSLASLDATHRKHVRRGLERCELRPLDPDELLADGLQLNLDTMARQGRFDPEFGEQRRWSRFVAATRACPEISVTGAFVGGRLSAYLVACREGRWLHLLYKSSRSADLPHRVNAAIDFHVTREAAADPAVDVVCSGFGSVLGEEPLHAYKIGMGYRVVPRWIGVQFHPALQPLLANRASAVVAGALARARPDDARLALVARHLAGAVRTRRSAPGRTP